MLLWAAESRTGADCCLCLFVCRWTPPFPCWGVQGCLENYGITSSATWRVAAGDSPPLPSASLPQVCCVSLMTEDCLTSGWTCGWVQGCLKNLKNFKNYILVILSRCTSAVFGLFFCSWFLLFHLLAEKRWIVITKMPFALQKHWMSTELVSRTTSEVLNITDSLFNSPSGYGNISRHGRPSNLTERQE